jgi:DnaK suppressor protein
VLFKGDETMNRNAAAVSSDAEPSKIDRKANGVSKTNAHISGLSTQITLPDDYRPSEDEEFMNPMQLLYFQKKLEAWKAELLDDATETITGLSQENLHQPDQMDRAQIESNAALDLRTRDRERKLLQKIESALRRIEDGSYGYCLETDEPISLRRLEARPIASLSLHAQERHERMERVYRDD